MNLILNARDAMPRGGDVALRLGRGAGPAGAEPGRWLLLTVADQGTGIDAATLPRIFDPFFTTKEQGKGTGLGLSVVHGVVKRAGGTISVDSVLGRGTTFSLHLPLVQEALDTAGAPQAESAAAGRGQTIVVVEDEPGVRRLVEKTLRLQGYDVHVAGNHDELGPLLAQIARPALLLTDVVLPGKSGPEIAIDLRQRFPGLKVLFMSGYVAPGIQTLGLMDPHAKLLSKPFAPETLCRAVGEELVDSPAREAAEPMKVCP
jgi:two-component system, cell cycle sensor histidine kinase and response regulator CckA